jgi:HK97 family phage major capsid protein
VGLPGWEREFRFYVPERVQKKGYAPAFEAYLRRGKDALGPTDFKTLTEGVDSAGGYLVPADVQTEIIKKLAAGSVMRQLCYSTPTSRDTVRWPRITYTTNDIYTSGVRLTWTGEVPSSATVHRVTDPVFGEINIPVHTAMASMPISNDLIDDAAYDVLGVSSELIAEAFRLGEDNVFLNGTGTGQPMGLLTQVTDTTGTTAPAYAVSGAAGALTTSGDAWSGKRLVDLYYALPAQYRARAAWVMCSSTMGALESLVDANDRPLVEPFAGGSIQTLAEPVKLKNKPVFVDEFVPSLTTNSYSVVLGDFFGYKILDRVGFSVQRLNELYAETNLTLLLAKKRVGGFCAEPYRFKVLKAGTS